MRYSILLLSFITIVGFSQSNTELFLQSVESNNKELVAAKNLMAAKILDTQTSLTPDNPVIDYGYFPGNNSDIGIKTTYGISQELEFPSVYFTKKKIAQTQIQVIDFEYMRIRKNILLKAQVKVNELIYFTKKEKEYQKRFQDAEKFYNSYSTKLKQGNASILDVNKAKILYLTSKNKYQIIIQEIERIQNNLIQLNGDHEFELNDSNYYFIDLVSLDQIKQEIIEKDPTLIMLIREIEMSKLNASLKKQNWLPSFEIGYEAETEPEGTYQGIKAGLSLPLWQNKNTVKQAGAEVLYVNSVYEQELQRIISDLENNYNKALIYKSMLNDYHEMLQTETDISLIEKAFSLGQISVIEYINELSMYYDIIDMYLETEKEYYQLVSEIFAFKL